MPAPIGFHGTHGCQLVKAQDTYVLEASSFPGKRQRALFRAAALFPRQLTYSDFGSSLQIVRPGYSLLSIPKQSPFQLLFPKGGKISYASEKELLRSSPEKLSPFLKEMTLKSIQNGDGHGEIQHFAPVSF